MIDKSQLGELGRNARKLALHESHPSEVAVKYLEEYSQLS
jgi:hypothetical protein